jgi:hypothetical protein
MNYIFHLIVTSQLPSGGAFALHLKALNCKCLSLRPGWLGKPIRTSGPEGDLGEHDFVTQPA